jgi:hypothetical protein
VALGSRADLTVERAGLQLIGDHEPPLAVPAEADTNVVGRVGVTKGVDRHGLV